MKPQDFISKIKDDAMVSAAQSKIYASFSIAEAALESAWGSSMLALQGHNLFGVKADKSWTGNTITFRTREFLNGRWCFVSALWRKYPSWLGCFTDHAEFLHHNKRYEKAFLAKSVEEFIVEIANAGYATDPLYASKIISIIKEHQLKSFDI